MTFAALRQRCFADAQNSGLQSQASSGCAAETKCSASWSRLSQAEVGAVGWLCIVLICCRLAGGTWC